MGHGPRWLWARCAGFRRAADGRALPAERSGRIEPGDEIVSVNGIHVDGAGMAATMQAVRDAGDSLLLRLRRSQSHGHA